MRNLLTTSLLVVAATMLGCNQTGYIPVDPPVPTADTTEVKDSESFQVKLETSKGIIVLEVHPEWAPKGAARFRELIDIGFYNECRFFRVIKGFMAQIGINGNPEVQAKWRSNQIMDDPVKKSNVRGYVSFATSGPNSRSTQFFINFGNNRSLDGQGFSPFAKVVEGMEVVDALYDGYGEGAPSGRGPDQSQMQYEGNKYLAERFPELDYIVKATIISDKTDDAAKEPSE